MIVDELIPGMQFEHPMIGKTITFVQQADHPLYRGLRLVIWWMGDRWSHDALSKVNIVGDPIPQSSIEYDRNLRGVFAAQRESTP